MVESRTRRPEKNATWHHRALLTGEPGTDAAWEAAKLTGDPRLAGSFWLEAGQDANADLYAQVPGADFDIIVHDGSWADMFEQVCAAWDEAHAVAEGGYPVALVVTSMSGVYAMFNDAADRRARRQYAAALASRGLDPAAAFSSEVHVEVHPDLRVLMSRRYSQLMAKILTWPGPVIMTARETRTPDGHWQLRGPDQLGFDATAWVRLTRDELPEIVSLNTAHHHSLNRAERAALRPEYTLDKLIWDWSGCDANTKAPELRAFDADQVLPGEQPVRVLQAVKTVRPAVSTHRRAVTAPAPPKTSSGTSTMTRDEQVVHFLDEWLLLSARDGVQPLWDRMHAEASGALDEPVAHLLSDEDRTSLSLAEGEPLTLLDLADRAAAHIGKTGTTLTGRERAGVA